MQSDVKIQGLVILFIFSILAFAIILSNLTYALKNFTHLHEKTLEEITKHSSSEQNPGISVGDGPTAIDVNYVTNTIYVTNQVDDTVSVINGSTNSMIGNIAVGRFPVAIGVDYDTNTIYVANRDDGTVSVIDGSTNSNIGNITVGRSPVAIGVSEDTNTIYVVNEDDDTVSVIDGKSNKLVAGVTFNTQPFNAGHIECPKGNLPVPIAQDFYLSSDFKCSAEPNQGFEFVSWQENLGGNSTRILKFTPPGTWDSVFGDSILDFFHMKPDKPEATLDITKFGSFTANFKALPPPIPPEYVAALFTVVVTAFVGTWLTPAVIGWRRAKKQVSKLDHYHNEVKNLYNDGLNSNDIEKLDALKNKIADDYSKGKINKEQYDKLGEEISVYYRKIFTSEIDSMKNLSENEEVKQLSEIKSNIEDAHAEGKINELHYSLLKERLGKYEKK